MCTCNPSSPVVKRETEAGGSLKLVATQPGVHSSQETLSQTRKETKTI